MQKKLPSQYCEKVNIWKLDPGMETMKLSSLMDLKMERDPQLQFTLTHRPTIAEVPMEQLYSLLRLKLC